MAGVSVGDVRKAIDDVAAKLLADEAVIYADLPTGGVRFVGQRPASWKDPSIRSLARAVLAVSLDMAPDAYLESVIEAREFENGNELMELAEELNDDFSTLRKIVEFRQRSLVPTMAPIRFEALLVEGHSAADVWFGKDEGRSFAFFGPFPEDVGFTARLFVSDVKYLIERLQTVLEKIEAVEVKKDEEG